MNIHLKRACSNCPFKREGGVELRAGRLAGIARELMADDQTPFLCHKTVYAKNNPGNVVVDEEGEETTVAGQKSSICAGSMTFLAKAGQPNFAMRVGVMLGMITPQEILAHADEIFDPEEVLRGPGVGQKT